MRRQPAFGELADRIPSPGCSLRVGGLPGSTPALMVASLAATHPRRHWLVVTDSPAAAESFEADLQALTDAQAAVLYPQRETLPYEASDHHVEVSGLRVEALEAMLAGHASILVTTARALQERTALPPGLADLRLTIRTGGEHAITDLVERLEDMGFERVPLVEGVGQLAVRGGIVDVFGFGAPEPVRLEFWGDEIASIRQFDILDQRSTSVVDRVDLLPVGFRQRDGDDGVARRSISDVLSADTVAVLVQPDTLDRDIDRTWNEVQHLFEAEVRRGAAPEPPASLFLSPTDARARIEAFGRVLVTSAPAADVRFDARPAEEFDRDTERLTTLLRAASARGETTYILCDNAGQLGRLEELIRAPRGAWPGTQLAVGALSAGFVLEGAEPPVRVLTDHEIFRRGRRLRRARRFRGAAALESLSQLKSGDFVVHMDHGVGRFLGLEHVTIGDEEIESLSIQYAGDEILRVPVYRLDLIERWVPDRDEAPAPKLHRIGGKSWRTLRAKTESAIREVAAELIRLYSLRKMTERAPYSSDTRWQKELESGFLYEDTPDQRQATEDVKKDMEGVTPMDRLLCGDVGYGKTEIAIRAAFKAVQDGRQVAVLAPTTILVEQHLHTFRERLAGFPVRVEALSRFRSRAEEAEILADLAAGRVDITVGTHRIIEPDVVFRDLGLLVIDEEQRFGVRQKERFKEMKTDIDVLSLTATPIPRTLHLSLAGLRDLSLLQTPPRDRMPIITHVLPWVDEVLEDAIRRELDRGGQVFVVHNRVQSIRGVAARIQRLMPDTATAVAHGQLPAAELEEVMRRFLSGGVRVLVTTSIIENGLDVPSANTLIVDRADLFGLAQLYQIRGRVGRSHHRAYCYLVVPENATPEAERRLRILEHFTDLGSGYAVALKDLELRGAGNILGAEQSGFVHAVGLDTYTRLLEDNIRRMRTGDVEVPKPTHVAIDGGAYLPDEYIADAAQKLHLYRRLSRLEDHAALVPLRDEVRDRYGPPPVEAQRLFTATHLRLIGTTLGIDQLLVRRDYARVNFRAGATPRVALLQRAFGNHQVEVELRRTEPLSLALYQRGAATIESILTSALGSLVDARSRAA